MKKLLLGILLLLAMVSCGSKPETVVSKFIDNIKEKKFDEAFNNYAVNKEAESNLKLEYENKFQQLFFETLFKNIEYKIIETKKQDNETSIVTVEVENVDVQEVFKKLFEKVLQDAFTKGNGTPLSVENEFKTMLESKDVPKAKYKTEFIVVKTEKGNKIEVTPENLDVLLGKLNTTLANLGSLGNDDSENNNLPIPKTDVTKEGPTSGENQKPNEPKIDKK